MERDSGKDVTKLVNDLVKKQILEKISPGWSVYHPIKLVRERVRPLPCGGELSLGELLQYKSQDGLRVVMLIWDDRTSHDKFLIKTVIALSFIHSFLFKCKMGSKADIVHLQDGVMQTHDEETKQFFKNLAVHCVLSLRYASNKLSIFKQQAWISCT
ncbi:hypothetical protein AHAS_Ahas06G0143900 [Arachis hypogaea]